MSVTAIIVGLLLAGTQTFQRNPSQIVFAGGILVALIGILALGERVGASVDELLPAPPQIAHPAAHAPRTERNSVALTAYQGGNTR
jgi:hypothetical protein